MLSTLDTTQVCSFCGRKGVSACKTPPDEVGVWPAAFGSVQLSTCKTGWRSEDFELNRVSD